MLHRVLRSAPSHFCLHNSKACGSPAIARAKGFPPLCSTWRHKHDKMQIFMGTERNGPSGPRSSAIEEKVRYAQHAACHWLLGVCCMPHAPFCMPHAVRCSILHATCVIDVAYCCAVYCALHAACCVPVSFGSCNACRMLLHVSCSPPPAPRMLHAACCLLPADCAKSSPVHERSLVQWSFQLFSTPRVSGGVAVGTLFSVVHAMTTLSQHCAKTCQNLSCQFLNLCPCLRLSLLVCLCLYVPVSVHL